MIITRFDDEDFLREKKRTEEQMKIFRESVTHVHAYHLFSDKELKNWSEEWLFKVADLRLRFISACGALNEDIGTASFSVKAEIKIKKQKMEEK